MDLSDSPEQARYRETVRAWLAEHRAEAPRRRAAATRTARTSPRGARWQGALAEGGLAGVTWPAEYGGQGLGPIEQVIVNQEISAAGVPGILDTIGVGMLGPTLIAHGTDEQKARYLGPMLHGDEVWCQLFSEPAAGSDLAGIQARARRQDDGSWRLTARRCGRRTRSSPSYGLLLARTDPDVPKHKGLTMFVVPMDAERRDHPRPAPDLRRGRVQRGLLRRRAPGAGRRRRPGRRRLGHGADDADVRAPDDRPRHRGHRLQARTASRRRSPPTRPRARDPEVRRRLGEIAADLIAVRFGGYRALTALQRGQIPGPEAGLAKVTLVNAAIAAGELIADTLGPDALEDGERVGVHDLVPAGPEVGGRHRGDPAQHDRRARARAAAGAAARQGHPVQRAARQGARGGGAS